MPRKQTPHDGSYRRLFSHAIMVEDLIRRYVAPPWVDRLDFSTLEMVPAHYVSDQLEQRESDAIWRLRYGPAGDWLFIYILIEFQSSVLRFMAIRVLTYIMLLYEDLISKKRLTKSGKLPPVVPIVLYNGSRPWTAPLQVAELIESIPGFDRPRFEYQVIDEGHLPREKIEPLDSPVAGVFQLEQSQGLEEIRRIVGTLIEVLDDPELRALERDMTTFTRRAILEGRPKSPAGGWGIRVGLRVRMGWARMPGRRPGILGRYKRDSRASRYPSFKTFRRPRSCWRNAQRPGPSSGWRKDLRKGARKAGRKAGARVAWKANGWL